MDHKHDICGSALDSVCVTKAPAEHVFVVRNHWRNVIASIAALYLEEEVMKSYAS